MVLLTAVPVSGPPAMAMGVMVATRALPLLGGAFWLLYARMDKG